MSASLNQLSDKPFIAPRVLAAFVRLLEGAFVAIIALANIARYPGFDGLNMPMAYFGAVTFAALAFPVLLHVAGAYRLNALLSPITWLPSVIASWVLVLAGVLAFTFLGKVGAEISRNWLLSWTVSGLMFAIAFRFVLSHFVRRMNKNGQLNRRAVLVGGGPSADHVIGTLNASHDTGLDRSWRV